MWNELRAIPNKLRATGSAIWSWYEEWIPWLAPPFIALSICFVVTKVSCGAREFLTNTITTQWAAALATFAAAWVALAIASGEQRRARRRDIQAGELAAASLRNYVGSLRVLAKRIEGNIPKGPPAVDPKVKADNEAGPALAGHLKDDITFLRQSLEKIPAATIRPYDARITAHVLHMIDQLYVAEVAAPFPGGEASVRIVLTVVYDSCLRVEGLIGPAREQAIQRYLAD